MFMSRNKKKRKVGGEAGIAGVDSFAAEFRGYFAFEVHLRALITFRSRRSPPASVQHLHLYTSNHARALRC